MSASKAVLGFSKSIIVDVSETAGLPDLIKNAYRTGGASIPIVIFTDPGVTKIFGRYDHPAMKSQKYGTIFWKKTALSTPVGRSGLPENQRPFSQKKKTALSTPVGRSGQVMSTPVGMGYLQDELE